MMSEIYFDDSLKKLVKIIDDHLPEQKIVDGLFVRDVSGRLAYFSSSKLTKVKISRVSKEIIVGLGEYARKDRPLADRSDFGVEELFLEPALRVQLNGRIFSLLDRRLVGADWLRSPSPLNVSTLRFVFASLKGGVGRTTALSVVAADLAAQGKSILVIDLDLEAPGIGSMLLDDGTTPEFGMIDALVEIGLKELSDTFMADLVGPSSLADRRGKIDVVPAFGRRSLSNPSEVLAKISRAYAEKVDQDGNVYSFLDKVSQIVEYFSELGRYDAILVDARAGLHETTASALLGLGAHLFLFGLHEPQTFQGYEALLSHLVRIDSIADNKEKWLSTVSLVQGKAAEDEKLLTSYSAEFETLFKKCGFVSDEITSKSIPLPAEPFFDVPWADDGDVADDDLMRNDPAVETLHIFHNNEFMRFNPKIRNDLLSSNVYKPVYQALLEKIAALMSNQREGEY
jgi:cellulose biosynthesis protein BcsQ